MKRSLSVLLPVHNVQRALESMVVDLLEVLPDLTPRFEVLLIDDGSTDDTSELAHDLARDYPQVHVARFAARLGRMTAVRSGLAQSMGEIVVVRDEGCQANVQELRKLWRLIDEYAAVIGRCAATGPRMRASVSEMLRDWGRSAGPAGLVEQGAGFQMYHRQVAHRLFQEAADCDNLAAELTRDGYRWCEVELRSQAAPRPTKPLLPTLRGVHHRADAPTATPAARPAAELKRPRYLDRIKAFALGE